MEHKELSKAQLDELFQELHIDMATDGLALVRTLLTIDYAVNGTHLKPLNDKDWAAVDRRMYMVYYTMQSGLMEFNKTCMERILTLMWKDEVDKDRKREEEHLLTAITTKTRWLAGMRILGCHHTLLVSLGHNSSATTHAGRILEMVEPMYARDARKVKDYGGIEGITAKLREEGYPL